VHARWQVVNNVVACAGVATSIGVGVLGFFPWDRLVFWHLICADAIFGGGLAWAIGSWILARRFASASHGVAMHHTWDSCRRWRRFQLPVVLACVGILVVACACFVAAYVHDPIMFSNGGPKQILIRARSDFHGYCSAKHGWHANAWINLVALCEWIYVLLLVFGVIFSIVDLEAHVAVQNDIRTLTVMLVDDDAVAWWRFW
jgi:hypothetical protein